MSETHEGVESTSSVSHRLISKSRQLDVPPELEGLREEFEAIYSKLSEIAGDFVVEYKNVLRPFDLDPGEVRIYMVGGRVRGTPLKMDSDIDLIIAVSNVRQTPGSSLVDAGKWGPMEAMEYKIILMQRVREKLAKICASYHVQDQFHILNYGSEIPKDDESENFLLLAKG
ncbi:MAG TPA: nucleotidyltransferase domain-containing protein [Patescibacteria group bacterium]|nr:nucleotidyltransferase domain-containing protein [Patescibacteria group bacterium]